MTLAARKAQVDEVADLNLSDSTQQEIRKWITAHPDVKEITTGRDEQVLGLHIVQMSSATAGQFDKDLPQAELIPDRPIDLIRPEKTAQGDVEGEDASESRHATRWREFFTKGCESHAGKGVTVAVLDTGVQADHPEFGGKQVVGGFTFDLATGLAVAQTPCVDTDTHGTHVAGLICGRTVGIAPEALVLSGVMIPGGRGSVAGFLIAMAWAAQKPEVQIVHLSAGLPGYVPEMRDAIDTLRACGVLVVAAIGNDGRNLTRSPGNFAEVLSVGSFGVNVNGRPRQSPFSSTGQMVVESHSYSVPRAIAPGEDIWSCVPGGGYEAWSGTSMAAPQISGVAARLIERNPVVQLVDLFAQIDELQMRWFSEYGPPPFEFLPFHPEMMHMMAKMFRQWM